MNDNELMMELAKRILCSGEQAQPTNTNGGFTVGEHVLVCTDKRGVFAGRLESYDATTKVAILTRIRNCIRFWDGRGVFGLQDRGPTTVNDAHRVGPEVPRGRLEGVTYIGSLTPIASKAWDEVATHGK